MFGNSRVFWKNVESISKAFTPGIRHRSAGRESEIGVTIPKRIERGPVDILKALSSTVHRDPTAFPYKYPDDPYFYPFSNNEKRVYALSIESGKKSAKWIVENNPGFFKNQLSDPPIEAFLPKQVYDENSEVTQEILATLIERRSVLDAVAVYELLQNKGTVISSDIKQDLLELVCFYNNKEKPNVEELESKWFGNVEYDKVEINVWKEQSFAETLFESMDPNCPKANAAIIQGMIKYNNVQKAFEIFQKAKSNNVKFPVGVYNALLSQASNNTLDITDGFTFIDTLLKEMAAEKVNPDLGTLNAALQSLANMQRLKRGNDYAIKLVMEFVHLGILPSLGTYYYLFRILTQMRRFAEAKKQMIMSLLQIIQSQKLEVRHKSDFQFFPKTMRLFSTVFKDMEFINLLNDILLQNDNVKFLENSFSESLYFRCYMNMVFKNEPIDIAMEKYREVIPTMYTPEFDVLSVVLSAIVNNGCADYFVEFWENVKAFKMHKFSKLLTQILPLVKVFTEEEALKVIHEAAVNYLQFYEKIGLERGNQKDISQIIIVFLKTGDDEKALELFEKTKDFKSRGALLSAEAITEVFNYALDRKNIPIMMNCLRYASDEIYSGIVEMAEKALPLLSHSKSEQAWVEELIKKAKDTEEENEESSSPSPSPSPSPSQTE